MCYKRKTSQELEHLIQQLARERKFPCNKCNSIVLPTRNLTDKSFCSSKLCRTPHNLWQGTLFYRSKLTKLQILQILELWMQKASMSLIKYLLRVERKCIWRLLKKVAEILVPRYNEPPGTIGGNGSVVEIDESKFGKRKYQRGHRVDGVWVFGAIEQGGDKRIKLTTVSDRRKETLEYVLTESVASDSVIHSDCFRSYSGLQEKFTAHSTVNHSVNFKDPITGVHINSIEGSWAAIKASIPPRKRTRSNVDLYLVRYMLLKNEKNASA
jgi:hypothetical protein